MEKILLKRLFSNKNKYNNYNNNNNNNNWLSNFNISKNLFYKMSTTIPWNTCNTLH